MEHAGRSGEATAKLIERFGKMFESVGRRPCVISYVYPHKCRYSSEGKRLCVTPHECPISAFPYRCPMRFQEKARQAVEKAQEAGKDVSVLLEKAGMAGSALDVERRFRSHADM